MRFLLNQDSKYCRLFFFSIFIIPLNIDIAAQPLTLQLQHAIDQYCDRSVDVAYTQTPSQTVLSKQCLRYRITATNNSNQTIENIVISGNIPEHTTLVKGSMILYNDKKQYINTLFPPLNSAQINSPTLKLSPYKTSTLFYTVRVN
ncbi:MAG: DUF11 domain-containing protein [Cocleimonas sp.]|nr:DUF11 domain-containing protein [Cocleimonas sp.]